MFNSLRSKIVIPSIGVLILLVLFIIVFTSVNVNNLADGFTAERLITASQTARAYMESLQERNRITSHAVSENQVVLELVRNWNNGVNMAESRIELINYLNSIKSDLGIDAFVVIGADATVMLRTHEDRYGDSVAGIPIFDDGLLRGMPTLNFSSTAALPMGMSALTPIRDGGEIIGTISTNVFMSNDEFVDGFSNSLNAEITVFAGNIRAATTLLNERGQRDLGTEAPQDIAEIVLVENRSFLGELSLAGIPLSAYYFPLHGWDGAPVGMFFAGFTNENLINATNTLQLLLIIISIAGLIITALVMLVLISRLLKPLNNLTASTRAVAAGNLNVNTSKKNLPKDEIGTLTNDVIDLVDVIKAMVEDLSVVRQIYSIQGNSKYRIDANKYQNSFRDMIISVNTIFDEEVDNIMSTVNSLNQICEGDFDIKVNELNGDWKAQPEAFYRLMTSLKAVSTEVGAMIDAVANKGNLSFKIDANKYQGGWREIMVGLNSISEAVDIPLNAIDIALKQMQSGYFDIAHLLQKIGDAGLPTDPAKYHGVFGQIVGSVNATMSEISSYITEISDDLTAIASGDLTTEISREYLGSFVDIKESLNSISATLNKTMSDIAAASDQVLSGARQISESAMGLANGATEQASSVQELNASIDMIFQQTQQNADSANEANTLSNRSTDNAKEGNEDMKQMLEAMLGIKEASNNISKIIKTIQEIAFQTNLLALNASVEAARAGEHGKGFAVVADEVRTLAGRSQTAAEETTSLIEDSIKRVNNGSNIAESTAKALDVIVNNADEMLEIINRISVSSKEQADAVGLVSAGLEQISSVVQSNSSVSEEAAAASEELTSQAELLRQLVAYFKL